VRWCTKPAEIGTKFAPFPSTKTDTFNNFNDLGVTGYKTQNTFVTCFVTRKISNK